MSNNIYILIVVIVLLVVFVYANSEGFRITNLGARGAIPYYTTTFQAYPGKFMNYDSTRHSYCLQQHQQYPGYRNCMLFLQ